MFGVCTILLHLECRLWEHEQHERIIITTKHERGTAMEYTMTVWEFNVKKQNKNKQKQNKKLKWRNDGISNSYTAHLFHCQVVSTAALMWIKQPEHANEEGRRREHTWKKAPATDDGGRSVEEERERPAVSRS